MLVFPVSYTHLDVYKRQFDYTWFMHMTKHIWLHKWWYFTILHEATEMCKDSSPQYGIKLRKCVRMAVYNIAWSQGNVQEWYSTIRHEAKEMCKSGMFFVCFSAFLTSITSKRFIHFPLLLWWMSCTFSMCNSLCDVLLYSVHQTLYYIFY